MFSGSYRLCSMLCLNETTNSEIYTYRHTLSLLDALPISPVTDTRTLPAIKPQPSRWVQTDRASHEAWARLSASNPKAGALLHLLAARVGDNNAVVVSHKTLAEWLVVSSITTFKTAITAIFSGNWIAVGRKCEKENA